MKNNNKSSQEVTQLKRALEETLWMANRYSAGRLTYAPSMFKDAFNSVKSLLNPIEVKRIEQDFVIKEIEKDTNEWRKEIQDKAISNFAEKIKKLIQEYGIQGKIHITPNKINEEIDKLAKEQSSGNKK